jgi:hypothetical protein
MLTARAWQGVVIRRAMQFRLPSGLASAKSRSVAARQILLVDVHFLTILDTFVRNKQAVHVQNPVNLGVIVKMPIRLVYWMSDVVVNGTAIHLIYSASSHVLHTTRPSVMR